MVVAMRLDVPEGDACEARGDLITFVPARPCAGDLEVAMDLDGAWSELPVSARQRVAALFDFVGVQRVVIEICSTMFQLRTQNRSYWKQPSPFCSRPRSL